VESEALLEVEPPEYYPIIDKLFADRLAEALEPFGASLEEMRVLVRREDKRLNLDLSMEISRDVSQLYNLESIVKGILEKLCGEATSSFGSLYGMSFVIAGLRIKEVPKRRVGGSTTLVVNGPQDVKPALTRVGKGLAIKLNEWGYKPLAITIVLNENSEVVVVVKMGTKLDTDTKESVREALVERTTAYLKGLLGVELPVRAEVLDPETGLVLSERERLSIEERVKKLLSREDVRKLMELFGKTP
jgi:hypothetical protein